MAVAWPSTDASTREVLSPTSAAVALTTSGTSWAGSTAKRTMFAASRAKYEASFVALSSSSRDTVTLVEWLVGMTWR